MEMATQLKLKMELWLLAQAVSTLSVNQVLELAAARALLDVPGMGAMEIAQKSMKIAA